MARVLSGILGVLIVIGGVYCVFTPYATVVSLSWLFGLIMLVEGISNIVTWAQYRNEMESSGWYLFSAIISLLAGLFLVGSFFVQFAVAAIMIYVIAIWLLVIGIIRIIGALKLRSAQKQMRAVNMPMPLGLSWGWALVFGILLTIFGILCIASPYVLAAFIGYFVGFAIIVAGINILGFAISGSK